MGKAFQLPSKLRLYSVPDASPHNKRQSSAEEIPHAGEKIGLPSEVAAALERVRVGGRTNMRDVPQVLALLLADEALDAADWVETHQAEYAQGVSRGFVIEGD